MTFRKETPARRYHITEEMIRTITDHERISRGLEYFEIGAVINLKLYANRITAKVLGTRKYSVLVKFNKWTGDAETFCTCPYDWGGACKHVVAALYAAIEQQNEEEWFAAEEDRESVEHGEEKAVEHTGTREKKNKWTKKIESYLLSETTTSAVQPSQVNWSLTYVIRNSANYVSLTACRQKYKKDGTPTESTVIYNYDLNDDGHYDEIDKLIIPNLANQDGLRIQKYFDPYSHPSRILKATPAQIFSTILKHLNNKAVMYADDIQREQFPISVCAEPVRLSFFFHGNNQHDTIQAYFKTERGHIELLTPIIILLKDPFWVLSGTTLYNIINTDQKTFEHLQRVEWKMNIAQETKEHFRSITLPRILERYPVESDTITIQTLEDGFSKRIFLDEKSDKLHVKLAYAYHGYQVPDHVEASPFVVAANDLQTFYRIERDFTAESEARRELLDTYMVEQQTNEFLPRQHPLDWILQKLPALAQGGFEVYGKENLRTLKVRSNPSVSVAVSSGIDWFDIGMDVAYDGVNATFKDIYHSIQKGDRFVKLADGTLGLIPEEWMKKFKRAFALTETKNGEWKFSRGHFSLIHQLFEEEAITRYDEGFVRYKEKFNNFTSNNEYPLAKEFNGMLRPYQKSGYDWLRFLKEFQFNGCLADDMGLGKTVQTLALLQHEYTDGATAPSLIIVPTSIVFNWINEARRFTPELNIVCHTGNKRRRSVQELMAHDVFITSYGTLRRDIEIMKDIQFHYIILDESQNIKNPGSQNAKAVRLLNARHRLTLTGTPVENNLMELWSQFDFLNPGLLGSQNSFQEQFIRPIERNKDEDALDMLKKTIYPFILRRTKDVVARELPPKTELIKYCEMEKPQRTLYNHWKEHYRSAILKSIDTVGLPHSKFKVLEGLMKLRQICCHPHLIDESFSGASGKYEVWKEMVGELLAENHKSLIFSQFVKMLRLLSDHCDSLEVDYEYLDGQTRDREERVRRFQENEDVRLFLISLKAGGAGLNLTAADYVIHYDPWWNPAVEMQATDRTHRIGQDKSIFSYKLITKDTIEEKILQLQEKKKELVQSIITAETGIMKKISREDIEMLFE